MALGEQGHGTMTRGACVHPVLVSMKAMCAERCGLEWDPRYCQLRELLAACTVFPLIASLRPTNQGQPAVIWQQVGC